MSFKLSDVSNGILTLRLTGELTVSEEAEYRRAVMELLLQKGDFRLLVILEGFEGFAAGKWGGPYTKNDDKIDRIAIVGDKKWEDAALMFTGTGLRRAEIEYFEPKDLSKASAWLAG